MRTAHATSFDAVRTNNMVALDNTHALTELDNMGTRSPAPTATQPALRTRVEVQWGEEWYAGVVTSRKRGANSEGVDAMLHRVLYDAAGAWHATQYYHDFDEVRWRAEAA